MSLVDHHAIPWPDDIRTALLAHLHADESVQATGLEASRHRT
jgi:4-hydroxybenzoyl-CoA thioesterase